MACSFECSSNALLCLYFSFHHLIYPSSKQGCAASGSLSKEDAAFICVEALETIPQKGLIFEVGGIWYLPYNISAKTGTRFFTAIFGQKCSDSTVLSNLLV